MRGIRFTDRPRGNEHPCWWRLHRDYISKAFDAIYNEGRGGLQKAGGHPRLYKLVA